MATTSVEELLERMLAGDEVAQDDLVGVLWPLAVEAVRTSRSLGRLKSSEDDVRDVALVVVEKIARDGGRGLRLYGSWRERNADKTFADWLRIVAGNAARDHVRRVLGSRKRDDGLPSAKRLLNEFGSSALLEELGVRPPMTAQQTAQELLAYARSRLRADQLRALELWIDGGDFEDVARDLELDGEEAARNLVRAAVAVLRRHFVVKPS
jgi:hypothetical protein